MFCCAAALISPGTVADWTDARCDIYPKGKDHASASIPCAFSQRQGYIAIDRSDGDNVVSPGEGQFVHTGSQMNGQSPLTMSSPIAFLWL